MPENGAYSPQIFEGNLIISQEVPPRVINTYYFFTIAVCAVFMALSLFNTQAEKNLKVKKEEQGTLIAQLNSLGTDVQLIQSVDKKTKFYKNSLEKRISLAEKTTQILDNVNPGLELLGGTVEGGKFSITLRGKNIYLFTQEIFSFLEKNYISEVSIVSANYDTSNEEFTVELSGVFK